MDKIIINGLSSKAFLDFPDWDFAPWKALNVSPELQETYKLFSSTNYTPFYQRNHIAVSGFRHNNLAADG